ncbi:MAG: hypothetical protein H3C31_06460 [Brumimicrobium sp.]|nr:hypothetical protein [Brumimicrobium sp.]MCO5268430.1 hypothetical protein [Brumimicrobium sp.]
MKKFIFILLVALISLTTSCEKGYVPPNDDVELDSIGNILVGTLNFSNGIVVNISDTSVYSESYMDIIQNGNNGWDTIYVINVNSGTNFIDGKYYNITFSMTSLNKPNPDLVGTYLTPWDATNDKIGETTIETYDNLNFGNLRTYIVTNNEPGTNNTIKLKNITTTGMKGTVQGHLKEFQDDLEVEVDLKFEVSGSHYSYGAH